MPYYGSETQYRDVSGRYAATGTLIGIDIQGMAQLQAKLAGLPPEIKHAVSDKVADYMLNVLRGYPPPKYVSLQEAYGGFRSDKQRRYFFWALKEGKIKTPYERTQRLSKGWKIIGKGEGAILANEVKYAGYVLGAEEDDPSQANMMSLIGWRRVDQIPFDRDKKITKIVDAETRKAIKRLGLG